MSATEDDALIEAGQPAPVRRRRLALILGSGLALVGVAALVFGSLQLASAASARDQARALATQRMEVRVEQESVQARTTEHGERADRLEEARTSVFDGILAILDSSDDVRRLYKDMVAAFNSSTDAFNAGNVSGGRAILESDVGEAITAVARAVRAQERSLAAVIDALAHIGGARES